MRFHSMEYQGAKLTHELKLKIGIVYMDLSKALDCLAHGFLLAKLHVYGLSEAACETMFDYSKHRKQ